MAEANGNGAKILWGLELVRTFSPIAALGFGGIAGYYAVSSRVDVAISNLAQHERRIVNLELHENEDRLEMSAVRESLARTAASLDGLTQELRRERMRP